LGIFQILDAQSKVARSLFWIACISCLLKWSKSLND
jgi:hypothetical protein